MVVTITEGVESMISLLPAKKFAHVHFSFVAVLFCLLCSAQFLHADSYTFTTFYGLDPTGLTYIYHINDSGQLLGTSDGQNFLYSNGSFTMLAGAPLAINNNGVVLGSYNTANSYYLYTNGNYSTITPPPGYNPAYFSYRGINDAGTLLANYYTFTGAQIYQEYGQPNVVTYGTSGVSSFPLYVPSSRAVAINNSGAIIGDLGETIDFEGSTGFVAVNNSITSITYPFTGPNANYPGNYTLLLSINNSGQILGYYEAGESTGYFIYSNGVFSNLNFPSGYSPTAINDEGQIAGSFFNGYNSSFHDIEDGFIATPVSSATPEPPTFMMAALVVAAGSRCLARITKHRGFLTETS